MSDFLDDLGDELEAVARRRARRRPRFAFAWSRRMLALALAGALALVAVPAAAVTGVFNSTPAPVRPDATQPGFVDVGPPCVGQRERTLQTTTAAPPTEVRALLGVLRRPQRPSDRLTGKDLDGLAALPIEAVNPSAIRRATHLGRTSIYLVPAENVRYFPPLPDTAGCKRFRLPKQKPVPGVCLVERNGAATCAAVEAISRGLSMLTSGGRRHGRTRVAGIAHDGVSAVIWRVHRGKGFLDTRIVVRNNVYAATVPSRAGHGLYVFFETPRGRELVAGPHRFTKEELAQRRRDKERDRLAGPEPTVFPRQGKSQTIFILRMRVPAENKVYVATWRGPSGTPCAKVPVNSIGLLPALRGIQAGLIRAPLGPPIGTRRWCPGHYTGTIRSQRQGRRDVTGPVLARFSFSVGSG